MAVTPVTTKHALTMGLVFAVGGVFSGILVGILLVFAAVGLLPLMPAYAADGPYAYGFVYHALHWLSWLPCVWLPSMYASGRTRRGFLLLVLAVHLVMAVGDAVIFLLALLGLLGAGLGVGAASMLGALVSAVLLVLSVATLAALWGVHGEDILPRHRRKAM